MNAKFWKVIDDLLVLDTDKGIVYNFCVSFNLIVIYGVLDGLDVCLQKTVTFSLL